MLSRRRAVQVLPVKQQGKQNCVDAQERPPLVVRNIAWLTCSSNGPRSNKGPLDGKDEVMATQTGMRGATSRRLGGRGTFGSMLATLLLALVALFTLAPTLAMAGQITVLAVPNDVKAHVQSLKIAEYNDSANVVSNEQTINSNGETFDKESGKLVHLAVEADPGYGVDWHVWSEGSNATHEIRQYNVYDPNSNSITRHSWFVMPDENVRVEARNLTALVTYKVKIHSDGAEDEKVIHTHEVVLGKVAPDIVATLSVSDPYRGEQLFLPEGWVTAEGQRYNINTPITAPIDLYARWPQSIGDSVSPTDPTVLTKDFKRLEFAINREVLTPIEVRLVPNGASTSTMQVNPGLETIYRNDSNLLVATDNPLWMLNLETGQLAYIESNATNKRITDDAVVYLDFTQASVQHLRFVARWVPVRFITAVDTATGSAERLVHTELVQFNSNENDGGYYGKGNLANRYTLPSTITRENKVFNGWTVYRNGSSYDSNTSYGGIYNYNSPVNEMLTLKAKWNSVTHTVTYYSANNIVGTDVVEHGSTTTAPTIVSAAGKLLNRWTTDPAGQHTYDFSTPVTGDLNLYAQWIDDIITDDEYHTVRYIAKSGDSQNELAVRLVKHGSFAPKIEVNFYDTNGNETKITEWTLDENGTQVFDFDRTPITEDRALYAKLPTDDEAYTVSFMVDNGLHELQLIASGGYVRVPAEPSQSGKAFEGWYTDLNDETTKLDTANKAAGEATTKRVTSNLVYHAKFTDIISGEVSVNYMYVSPEDGVVTKATGVKLSNGTDAPTRVTKGSKIEAPAEISNRTPIPADTTLKWFNDPTCSVAYDFDALVEDDLTIYASYIKENTSNSYKVSYYVGSTLYDEQEVVEGGLPERRAPENPTPPDGVQGEFEGWHIGSTTGPLWRDAGYNWGPTVEGVYADVFVYAAWAAASTHTVTFYNADYENNPYTISIPDGETLTVQQTREAATAVGLDPDADENVAFTWYCNKDCTATFDITKPITEDTTLWAKVRDPKRNFTVYFKTKVGKDIKEISKVDMTYGDTKPDAPDISNYAAAGYSFDSWRVGTVDGPDPDGVKWENVEKVIDNTYVYAIWKETSPSVEQYTVNFVSLGKTVATHVINKGQSVTAPVVKLQNRDDAVFEGWYTTENFAEGTRVGGAQMTVTPPSSITYYAHFVDGDGITITTQTWMVRFFINNELKNTLLVDDNSSLHATTTGTSEGAYLSDSYDNFDGWYTKRDWTEADTAYESDNLPLVTDDTDYYGSGTQKVVPPANHTVTFMNGNTQVEVKAVKDGETVTAPIVVNKDDKLPDRWTTDLGGKDTYDFSQPVHSSFTLYAQWDNEGGPEPGEDEYHIVTFYAVHGNNQLLELAKREVKHGNTTTALDASYFDPDKDITTISWTTDREGLNVFDFANTAINEDISLYAKWSEDDNVIREKTDRHFAVRFVVNQSLFAVQDVIENGYVKVPATPSQTGKDFEGWYLNLEDVSTKLDIDGKQPGDTTEKQVKESLTYYAKFVDSEAGDHSVTYKFVDASGLIWDAYDVLVGGSPAPTRIADQRTLSMPDSIGNYELNEDEELVWYLDSNCSVIYDFGSPVTDDLVLYAKATSTTIVDEIVHVYYIVGDKVYATYNVQRGGMPEGKPDNPPLPANIVSGSFAGWRIGGETGPLWLDAEGEFAPSVYGVNEDTYVYATWNVDPAYTVTFINADDTTKTWQLVVIDKKDVDTDGVITAEDTRNAAIHVGLTDLATAAGEGRVSWFSDLNCKVEYDTTKLVESNLTLYASATATVIDNPRYVRFYSLGKLVREVTMPVDSTTPPAAPTAAELTRDNYRLVGWRVGTAEGDDPNGVDYEKVSNIYANTHVYAQWEPELSPSEQYTITFKSLDDIVKTFVINKGESITAPVVSVPVEGAVFEGWYDNPSFDGEVALADRATTIPTSNMTYYAKFTKDGEPIRTRYFTISFFVNDAHVASTQVPQDTKPYATFDGTQSGTLLSSGYTDFNGWYRDRDLTDPQGGLAYNELDRATKEASYYASATGITPSDWYHKVTYMNGSTVVATDRVIHGGKTSAPTTTDANGKVPDRWTTDEKGLNTFDFATSIQSDLTLYAQWNGDNDVDEPGEETNVYHFVTFVARHGSNENVLEKREVKHGNYTTALNASYYAGNKLITASAWTRDIAGLDVFDFTATPITEDITLYAKWSEDDDTIKTDPSTHYTVTFISQGSIFAVQNIQSGSYVTVPETPVVAGKAFDGWFTEADGRGSELSVAGLSVGERTNQQVSSNMTFYAKFSNAEPDSNTDHTITYKYVTDDGTIVDAKGVRVGTAAAPTTVRHGQTISKPTSITNRAAASGETLTWFIDDRCSAAYDFSSEVNADLTIYAKYITVIDGPGDSGEPDNRPIFTVTYMANGNVYKRHTIRQGDMPTDADKPTWPPRPANIVSGSFAGWRLGGEQGPMWLDVDGHFAPNITGVYADIYAYASWNVDPTYTVTFVNVDTEGSTSITVVNKEDDDSDGRLTAEQTIAAAQTVGLTVADDASSYTWYADRSCSAVFDISSPIKTNFTLYASDDPSIGIPDDEEHTVYFISLGREVKRVTLPAGVSDKPAAPTAAEISREGYRLDGWRVGSAEGDNPEGADWSNVASVNSDTWVYAQWVSADISNEQYKVTFISQGDTVLVAFVNKGDSLTAPAVSLPSKNATFAGWYRNADFSGGVALQDRQSFTPEGNEIYYAKFMDGDTVIDETLFTISFLVNSELKGSVQLAAGAKPYPTSDGTSSGAPIRNSYASFNGWHGAADLSDAALDDDMIPVATGRASYYASGSISAPDATHHTVTFISGGRVIARETVVHGATVFEPKAVDGVSKLAERWTTDEAGNTVYNFDDPVMSDLTLYAQWTGEKPDGPASEDDDPNYHVVSFVATHGGVEKVLDRREVKHGELVQRLEARYYAENKEIVVSEWTTDAAGQNVFDFAATPIVDDITLYAKWSVDDDIIRQDTNTHFRVAFMVSESLFAVQDVIDGGFVMVPETPAQTGKAFEGWYTGENGTGSKLVNSNNANVGDATSTVVHEDKVYYANFIDTTQGMTHAVRYMYVNEEGAVTQATGVMVGSTPAATSVLDGDTIAQPTRITNRAAGTDSLVWFVDETCTVSYNFASPVHANLVLYAKYVATTSEPNPGEPDMRPLYTVNYFVDGSLYATQMVREGTLPVANIPTNPPLPARIVSGSFAGWHIGSENGSPWRNASYEYDPAVKGVYANTNVYAVWNADPVYTVNFVNVADEGGTYALTVVNRASSQTDGRITVADTRNAATEVGLTPSDDGREFTWYVDRGCTASYDIASEVTSNFTLYAGEQAPDPQGNRYVHFISLGKEVIAPVELTDGNTTPPAAPEVTRDGFRLTGWRVGSSEGPDSTGAMYSSVKAVNADLWVYAEWASAVPLTESYTVTFMSLGDPVMVAVVNAGEHVTAPSVTLPSEENVRFVGWYDNADFSGEIAIADRGSVAVTRDIIYYAKFVDENDTTIVGDYYTVAFFVNNVLKASSQLKSGDKPYPTDTGKEAGVLIRLAYDQSTFNGWYYNRALSSPEIALADTELPPVIAKTNYYASAEIPKSGPTGEPMAVSVTKVRNDGIASGTWSNFSINVASSNSTVTPNVLFAGALNTTTEASFNSFVNASVTLTAGTLPAGYEIEKWEITGNGLTGSAANNLVLTPSASTQSVTFTVDAAHNQVKAYVRPITYTITQTGDFNKWYKGNSPKLYDPSDGNYRYTYTVESPDLTLPDASGFEPLANWTFVKWTGTIKQGGKLIFVDGLTEDGSTSEISATDQSKTVGDNPADLRGLLTIKKGSYGDIVLTPNWLQDPHYLPLNEPDTATNQETLIDEHYPTRIAIHYGLSVIAENGGVGAEAYTKIMRNEDDEPFAMIPDSDHLPERVIRITMLDADGNEWQGREVSYDFDGYWNKLNPNDGLHAATEATQYIDGKGLPTASLSNRSMPADPLVYVAWKPLTESEAAKLVLPETTPVSPSGKSFKRWSVAWATAEGRPSNYEASYQPGATLPELLAVDTMDHHVILTPIFEDTSYSITYLRGDDLPENVNVTLPQSESDLSYTENMTSDKVLSPAKADDSGYSFLGWVRESPRGDDNIIEETNGDYVIAIKPGSHTDVTYKARFAPNRYEVTLKPGDRTNTDEVTDPSTIYVEYQYSDRVFANATGRTAATIHKPERSYKVTYMNDTTGDEKFLGPIDHDVPFEAYVMPDGDAYITFSESGEPVFPDNKIFGITSDLTLTGTWDAEKSVITMPQAPSYADRFMGWYRYEVDGSDERQLSDLIPVGGTYTLQGTSEDVFFRPRWRDVDDSVITYTSEPEGASYEAGYNPNQLTYKSAQAPITLSLTEPVLGGYTFAGWTLTRTKESDTFSLDGFVADSGLVRDDEVSTADRVVFNKRGNAQTARIVIPADTTVAIRDITLTAVFEAEDYDLEIDLNDGDIRKNPEDPTKKRLPEASYQAAMPSVGFVLEQNSPNSVYIKAGGFSPSDEDFTIVDPSQQPRGYSFNGWLIPNVRSIEEQVGSWLITTDAEGDKGGVVRYRVSRAISAADATDLSAAAEASTELPYVRENGNTYRVLPGNILALASGSYGDAHLTASWEPAHYMLSLWLNGASSPDATADGIEDASYITPDGELSLPRATMEGTYDEPFVPGPKVDGLERVTDVYYHGNTGDPTQDANWYDSHAVLKHTFTGWDLNRTGGRSTVTRGITQDTTELGINLSNSIYESSLNSANGPSLFARWDLANLASQGLYRDRSTVNARNDGYTFIGWVQGEGADAQAAAANAQAKIFGNDPERPGYYLVNNNQSVPGVNEVYKAALLDESLTNPLDSADLKEWLVQPDETFDGAREVHLFGVWIANYTITYKDTYDRVLGEEDWPTVTGACPYPTEYIFTDGGDYITLDPQYSPNRYGYTFVGWTIDSPTGAWLTYNSDPELGEIGYQLPKTIGNKVLYAHFEVISEYIDFDVTLPNRKGAVSFKVTGKPFARDFSDPDSYESQDIVSVVTVRAETLNTTSDGTSYKGQAHLLLPVNNPTDAVGYTVEAIEAFPWFNLTEGTMTSTGQVEGLVASGINVQKVSNESERHKVVYVANADADEWTNKHRSAMVFNEMTPFS